MRQVAHVSKLPEQVGDHRAGLALCGEAEELATPSSQLTAVITAVLCTVVPHTDTTYDTGP